MYKKPVYKKIRIRIFKNELEKESFRTRPLSWFLMKKTCKKTQSQIEIAGSSEKFAYLYFCLAFVKTRRPEKLEKECTVSIEKVPFRD